MAEQPTGQLSEEQLKAQEKQEPQPQQTPVVPEKLQGKSAEEIARAYAELEKKLGEQSQEVGQLRNEAAYYRELAGRVVQQPGQPSAQPTYAQGPTTEAGGDFWSRFSDRPEEAIGGVMDRKFGEYARVQEGRLAAMSARVGKKEAVGNRPELFKDIEDKVEDAVKNSFRSGVITAEHLSDPRTWYIAALGVRGEETDYKFYNQPVRPVSPTSTEIPNMSGRTGEEAPEVQIINEDEDLDTSKFLRHFYGDKAKEKAAELIRGKKGGR